MKCQKSDQLSLNWWQSSPPVWREWVATLDLSTQPLTPALTSSPADDPVEETDTPAALDRTELCGLEKT